MAGEATAKKPVDRETWYAELMAHASGQGNDDALARMYASWMTGEGALPDYWGLAPAAFAQLFAHHFPGYGELRMPRDVAPADVERNDEQGELRRLMAGLRAGVTASELWVADIVASACMASDHLWQDLGLWCRDDLSQLMQRNFPALADRNVHNMKWKKFLYKQLCDAEGIYVCRSPSCEVCADYQACFGPEE